MPSPRAAAVPPSVLASRCDCICRCPRAACRVLIRCACRSCAASAAARAPQELLNPLENAVVSMRAKNRDLAENVAAAADMPDRSAPQSFTMLISGACSP